MITHPTELNFNNGLTDLETLGLFDDDCLDPRSVVGSYLQRSQSFFSVHQALQLHESRAEEDSSIDLEALEFFGENYPHLSYSSSFEDKNATISGISKNAEITLGTSDKNLLNSNHDDRRENNLDNELYFLDMSDFSLLQMKSNEITKLNSEAMLGELVVSEPKTQTFLSSARKTIDDCDTKFAAPKTYTCRYCTKFFYNRTACRRHQLCHVKKLLRCAYCRHRTRSSGGLVRHMQYYHCYRSSRRIDNICYYSK